MMFTLMMVSYTATSMSLAIAAGQSVVAVANLLMTITFVFMIVSSIIQFSRLTPEILAMLKSKKSYQHRVQLNSAKRLWG